MGYNYCMNCGIKLKQKEKKMRFDPYYEDLSGIYVPIVYCDVCYGEACDEL